MANGDPAAIWQFSSPEHRHYPQPVPRATHIRLLCPLGRRHHLFKGGPSARLSPGAGLPTGCAQDGGHHTLWPVRVPADVLRPQGCGADVLALDGLCAA